MIGALKSERIDDERQGSVHKVPQSASVPWVAQFAQGLGFDLANAFPRDAELSSYLIQRVGTSILEAKAQLDHAPFPGA
jgi:hypothetical protein